MGKVQYSNIREWLQSELQKVDIRRNDLLTAIRIENERQSATDEGSPVPSDNGDNDLLHLNIDLEGAKNLIERLIRIAVATGKPINAKHAAAYLIKKGVSKSTVANFRPHIYNELNEHEDFEKIGEGTFEYMLSRTEHSVSNSYGTD